MTRVRGPAVSALGQVLARAVADPGFRALVAGDPDTALSAYSVDDVDLEFLRDHLADAAGSPVEHAVVTRPLNRPTIFGFLDDFVANGGLESMDIEERQQRRDRSQRRAS